MMFKKVKSLLSLLICISVLCTVMPITSYAADAAENVASVTFNGTQNITQQSTMRGMRLLRWIPLRKIKQRLSYLLIVRQKIRSQIQRTIWFWTQTEKP